MSKMAYDSLGNPIQALYLTHFANLTIGATVQTSAAIAEAGVVFLTCDGDCFYEVGPNPTAPANKTPLFAKAGIYVRVDANDKIAVIQKGTATGTAVIATCKN